MADDENGCEVEEPIHCPGGQADGRYEMHHEANKHRRRQAIPLRLCQASRAQRTECSNRMESQKLVLTTRSLVAQGRAITLT